jgi:hypothetical protein
MNLKTTFKTIRTTFIAVTTVAALATAGVGRASAQIEAGALATWADLSTWSRPDPAAGGTEVGLGLVVEGPDGAMRLAFFVIERQRGGRTPPPAQIGVRAAAGSRMNPNLLRTPTLAFILRTPGQETEEIDVSSTMTVDNPAPGAAVTSGVGHIPVARFRALTTSKEVLARIFGAEVALREDQLEAIRAFRERVLPAR